MEQICSKLKVSFCIVPDVSAFSLPVMCVVISAKSCSSLFLCLTAGMTLRKNLQLAVLEILEGVLGLVASLAEFDPGCVQSVITDVGDVIVIVIAVIVLSPSSPSSLSALALLSSR